MKKFILVGGPHEGHRYQIYRGKFELIVAGASALMASLQLLEAAGVNTRFTVTSVEKFAKEVLFTAKRVGDEHSYDCVIDIADADNRQQELLEACVLAAQARFIQERADLQLGFEGNKDTGWNVGSKANSCRELRALIEGPADSQVRFDEAPTPL
jgi:hypothetical protein